MRKLLRITPSINPTLGGPIAAARQIDEALTHLGISIETVCLDDPLGNEHLDLYPTKVYALGPSRRNYRFSRKLHPWLLENLDKYDLVIVDGLWQYHAFAARRALAKKGIPYIVIPHGMLATWFKRKHPIKHLKKMLYWSLSEFFLLKNAKFVLFTSKEELLDAHQSFWPFRCNGAVSTLGITSPNLSKTALSDRFTSEFPDLRGKEYILFLGRIDPIKGCDHLITAFARLSKIRPNIHLVFAGPGRESYISTLKAMANALGVSERIIWTGMLSSDTKWGAYLNAAVFCLPSHHENFGMVVAESLAMHCPVVISNKVNIWQEIVSGHAGLVCNDDSDSTYTALSAFFNLDPSVLSQMKASARAVFDDLFRADAAAIQLMQYIDAN